MIPLSPVELVGARVRLLPLHSSHTQGLWHAAQDERIWTYMPVRMQSLDDMRHSIDAALAAQEVGAELPFTVCERDTGRIVGSTRFLDIALPHRGLEIGATWLNPAAWRTRVNTECKFLLLRHCFEALGTIRVCLKTDARNTRSQAAIARIGGVREGVLRSQRILPDGYVRDTVYFSILADEWPAVKQSLEHALAPPEGER